jgi:pre-mRNA-processing factor 19
MSFICEISGESLLTLPKDDPIVVTPSGHICRRRLLLTKLLENGGIDPFETRRPLREEELIVLKLPNHGSSSIIPPPRNFNSHTMTSSIQQIQLEYDALVLELYDTRQSLEDTRKELSLALYQNDAAIRVVARISAERDDALQTLQQWNASASISVTAPTPSIIDNDEPVSKKAKLTNDDTNTGQDVGVPPVNSIPDADLQIMLATWDSLHQSRKARQKAALQNVVTMPQLQSYHQLPTVSNTDVAEDRRTDVPMSDKPMATCLATCRGRSPADQTITDLVVHVGTHSGMIFMYEKVKDDASTDEKWTCSRTIPLRRDSTGVCSKIDMVSSPAGNDIITTVATTDPEHQIQIFVNDTFSESCSLPTQKSDDDIVDLRWHPDLQHFVVTTRRGGIFIGLFNSRDDPHKPLAFVAQFVQEGADASTVQYSAASLHPDGLIYVTAVRGSGDLLLWDFKSQSLAGTLELPQNLKVATPEKDFTVTSVEFSNNGYHVAVAYAAGILAVWDLRKQSILKILNDDSDDKKLDRIVSVQFDPSGKYLAYSGSIGSDMVVAITTVKAWSRTMTFQESNVEACPGLVWGKTWIAVSAIESGASKRDSNIVFFGLSSK